MKCPYCDIFESDNKFSFSNHKRCCKSNPNHITAFKDGPWNRGLSKETSPILKNAGKKTSEKLVGRKLTREQKENLSIQAKKRGLGGYTKGGGRGKKGRYNGIWCDSSWELAYVIYCLDHQIDIQRCTEVRTYSNNKKYYPDFLVNGVIVEIKGWKSPQWEQKIKENPDIVVIGRDEIQPFIDYVVGKYGKNFINLYDS